jgi:hypothetical protein
MREFKGYKIPDGLTAENYTALERHGYVCAITRDNDSVADCSGIECDGCACNYRRIDQEELIEYLKKENEMEMPELKSGMVLEYETEQRYMYVTPERAYRIGNCNAGYASDPMNNEITKVYTCDAFCGLGAISSGNLDVIWEKESPKQKKIKELKETMAKAQRQLEDLEDE